MLEYRGVTDASDPLADPEPDSGDSPAELRLLTPAEAAEACGLARKVITGRMDRGTLRVVRDEAGTRRVPRAELVRAGLLGASHPATSPAGVGAGHGGEMVLLRELYERERSERAVAEAQAAELRVTLAELASAGPIRALRLRRALRQIPAGDPSPGRPVEA